MLMLPATRVLIGRLLLDLLVSGLDPSLLGRSMECTLDVEVDAVLTPISVLARRLAPYRPPVAEVACSAYSSEFLGFRDASGT
jgi:hypothetical protein